MPKGRTIAVVSRMLRLAWDRFQRAKVSRMLHSEQDRFPNGSGRSREKRSLLRAHTEADRRGCNAGTCAMGGFAMGSGAESGDEARYSRGRRRARSADADVGGRVPLPNRAAPSTARRRDADPLRASRRRSAASRPRGRGVARARDRRRQRSLTEAFREANRSDRARADIAQVLTAVAADDLERLLRPEEIQDLSLLSIDTLLERSARSRRYRAGGRALSGSSRNERRALLDAIGFANQPPAGPRPSRRGARCALCPRGRRVAARAHDPSLVGARRARERPRARALARSHPRQRASERARGAPPARPPRSSSGDAQPRSLDERRRHDRELQRRHPSFPRRSSSAISCSPASASRPALRAVNLITAVSSDTAGEIGKALEEGQSIPVTSIDVPTGSPPDRGRAAANDRARAERCRTGTAKQRRYLRRPLAVARSLAAASPAATGFTEPPSRASPSSAPYAGWMFGEGELAVPKALAGDAALSSRRIQAAGRSALRALAGTPTAKRLAAMLRHQSEIHRLRSETLLAGRSLAAAHDIEQHGLEASPFARRMVERSMLARLLQRPADAARRRARSLQANDRGARRAQPSRRRHARSRRGALSPDREPERALRAGRSPDARADGIDRARGGEIAANELSRDASEQARLPGMERPETTSLAKVRRRVNAETTVSTIERGVRRGDRRPRPASPNRPKQRLAEALAGTARWFADEICLRRCRRECLLAPELDGRDLFFLRSHPAGIDFGAADGRRRS